MAIKFDLFKEWIPSITDKKGRYLYSGVADSGVSEEIYMICRVLSQYEDCLPFANIVNQKMSDKIDGKLSYDFLYYIIPKYKRAFVTWGKTKKEMEDVELVKKAFNCNNERAKEYLNLISPEQLEKMRSNFDTGGRA